MLPLTIASHASSRSICFCAIFMLISSCFGISHQSVDPLFDEGELDVVNSDESAENGEEAPEGAQKWAVLVAGSNGWFNYRHQADVCHAYQSLINHGIAPERIITMMYDDIAHNKLNPHKGKIFNEPDGDDVYSGVKIDYKGNHVNIDNFRAVLLGDESKSNGKPVLKSNENDKVFIYFTDHGAAGLICLPNEELTVKELTSILKEMHAKKMYKELTFYLEACESGSMFEHSLAKDMKIYAVTAANDHESSWGCYCDTPTLPGNCLGDLFSVNWMQDTDKENLRSETLRTQFNIVQRETNRSHVENFGDLQIEEEHVGEFMGNKPGKRNQRKKPQSPHNFAMFPSRDIPLLMMGRHKYHSHLARHKLHVAQKKRIHLEEKMKQIVASLIHDPNNRRHVLTTHPGQIRDMDCHDEVVHAFSNFCFKLTKNPYALKYVFVLANLCERPELDAERIKSVLMEHCADVGIDGII